MGLFNRKSFRRSSWRRRNTNYQTICWRICIPSPTSHEVQRLVIPMFARFRTLSEKWIWWVSLSGMLQLDQKMAKSPRKSLWRKQHESPPFPFSLPTKSTFSSTLQVSTRLPADYPTATFNEFWTPVGENHSGLPRTQRNGRPI